MESHFKDYFHEFSEEKQEGRFHRVIALQDDHDLEWKEISLLAPTLPRGWWELSKLSKEERIDLISQYWEKKMEPFPYFCTFLANFFQQVDDIGVFLTQRTIDHAFEAQLVYSLSRSGCFFRGLPPILEKDLNRLKDSFKETLFPSDYIAFLEIHNGFFKTTDVTGLIKAENIKKEYETFQNYFAADEVLLTSNKVAVDPKKLIPFYISFGMPFYQCFYADWYPEQEMGNVYCSLQERLVSDLRDDGFGSNMSFPTFNDWLAFYMECINK